MQITWLYLTEQVKCITILFWRNSANQHASSYHDCIRQSCLSNKSKPDQLIN